MNTKLILVCIAIAALSGCATTSQSNYDVVDLNYYKVDCNKRDQELAFLKRQFATPFQKLMNGLRMTGMIGTALTVADGTYTEQMAMFNGEQEAIARALIRDIEWHCPTPEVKIVNPESQGCIKINESMGNGMSIGTICKQNSNGNKNGKPIPNRWEAMVDSK